MEERDRPPDELQGGPDPGQEKSWQSGWISIVVRRTKDIPKGVGGERIAWELARVSCRVMYVVTKAREGGRKLERGHMSIHNGGAQERQKDIHTQKR